MAETRRTIPGPEQEQDQETFSVGDRVAYKGKRQSGENHYIVREVKQDTLLISGNNEFHEEYTDGSSNATDDGYVSETIEVDKDKLVKVD